MKIIRLTAAFAIVATMLALASCNDGKSYAQLLNDEDRYVNNFLADQNVITSIPEDTVFITGPDAPYYRIDDDGMLYMQVLDPGTPGNMVSTDDQIYFRYTRYALAAYSNGKLPQGEGNNYTLTPCWFRYNNYQIQASYQWGTGIQTPLSLLPIDCKINLIVKSQLGVTDETANVQPYLWTLTYEQKQ